MDVIDRIYRLYGLLRSARHPVPLRRMTAELECSRSTAVRTIEHMRDYLGAPIDYDRARNGYFLRPTENGPWELPGLWFNASELHALLAAYELLANVQPGLFDEALAPLKDRIEKLLQSRRGGSPEIGRRVRLLRVATRRVEPEHFRAVADALVTRRRLCLVYHGRGRDEVTEREVSPQRLVHYRDNWYLDAWDHGKRALRNFAVERIRAVRKLDRPARDIADARLDEHQSAAYGIFGGRPRRVAVLRFTPERARWVADETWHPQQQASWRSDGYYELRVPYADPRELILDISRYGADVEVVSPPSLRRAVYLHLLAATRQYARLKKAAPAHRLGAKSSIRPSRRTGAQREPVPPVGS